MLLRVGRRRLGEPDVQTQSAIKAIAELEQLETLVERVVEVENWVELFTLSA